MIKVTLMETAFSIRQALIAVSVLAAVFLVQSSGEASASCLSPSSKADITACTQELNSNPRDIRIRKALADALIDLGRRQEATNLLKEGLQIYPEDEQMQRMLKLQESFLEERAWSEKQRAKREAGGADKLDPRIKLSIIRCTKLKGKSALDACNEGLGLLPGDLDLVLGKSDVLLEMNRIAEAIALLREAAASHPTDPRPAEMLSLAESKRKAVSGQCFKLRGADALQACDDALLKGAPDEFRIQRRRADLLFQENRTAAAPKAATKAAKDPSVSTERGAPEGRKSDSTTERLPAKTLAKISPPVIPESEPETGSPVNVSQARRSEKEPAALPSVSAKRVVYSNAPITPGITY